MNLECAEICVSPLVTGVCVSAENEAPPPPYHQRGAQRVCCVGTLLLFSSTGGRRGFSSSSPSPGRRRSSTRAFTLLGAFDECGSDWCPPTEFKLAILDWCASKSSLWVRTQQVHRTFVRVKVRASGVDPSACGARGDYPPSRHTLYRRNPLCLCPHPIKPRNRCQ